MPLKNWVSDKINLPLTAIILLAVLLRVPFLANAPSSFSVDEASYAYDAYSISETLRDRYGVFLPTFVRAFDDYRESLYIYLLIPFIKVLGLNEFGARFPAALIGVLTVITVYYLGEACFNRKVGLAAALLLAISPWHIFFSRICFRAILLPLLFCWGLFFFIKSLRKPNALPLSGLFFGLTLYTYPSARVFVPLFLIGLAVLFRQHLWAHRTQTLIASAIFLPIFILLFSFWITPAGMARGNETGIDANPLQLLVNYLSYFDPTYLFIRGDPNPRRSISTWGIGELHLFELLTVLPGLFFLSKEEKQTRHLFFLWLLLYPIPAALIEPAHAIRSLIGAPLFSLVSAYGFFQLLDKFSADKKKIVLASSFIVTLSLVFFLNAYFVHYSTYTISRVSKNWQFGMRAAIAYAESSPASCVLVSDRFWRPNIYILFYANYPPTVHQQSPIDPGLTTNYSLGKYQITAIAGLKPAMRNQSCLLLLKPEETKVLDQQAIPWQPADSILDPGGLTAIELVTAQL